MLEIWEKREGFTSHAGVLLISGLLSQYRSLPKANGNGSTHKNDASTLS